MISVLLTVLKIIGIILIVLIFALTVLLFIKIRVIIGYKDEFFLSLRILFVNIRIFPRKKKNNKKKKTKEKKPDGEQNTDKTEKKSGIGAKFRTLGIDGYIELIKIVVNKFVKKIYAEQLDLDITVASDDAAQTAVNYGKLNAAVYPLVSLINEHRKIKKLHIGITPDFTAPKSEYRAEAVIYTRACHAVAALISILKYIL